MKDSFSALRLCAVVAMLACTCALLGCANDEDSRGPALVTSSDAVEGSLTVGGPVCDSLPNTIGCRYVYEEPDWLYFQWEDPNVIEKIVAVKNERWTSFTDVRVSVRGFYESQCPTFTDCAQVDEIQINVPNNTIAEYESIQYTWLPKQTVCDAVARSAPPQAAQFDIVARFAYGTDLVAQAFSGEAGETQMVAPSTVPFYMYPGWVQCNIRR